MLITARMPAKSEIPLSDRRFCYTPSARTDVQATWARFGWTAPSTARSAAHV